MFALICGNDLRNRKLGVLAMRSGQESLLAGTFVHHDAYGQRRSKARLTWSRAASCLRIVTRVEVHESLIGYIPSLAAGAEGL